MALFAVLAGVVYVAGTAIVATDAFRLEPRTLSLALSVDLTLGIVAAAWLLLVRQAGLPPLTLAPVFLASVLAAGLVLPADGRGIVDGLVVGAQVLELVVVAYALTKVVRVARRTSGARAAAGDTLTALHDAMAIELGPRAAGVLATELAVGGYALGGWFRHPRPPEGSQVFGTLRAWRPMLGALVLLFIVETVGLHLLVSLASPAIAWVLTLLSLYGVAWLIGDAQAARHRPVLVDDTTVLVRTGLRWTAVVPREQLVSVERIRGRPGDPRADLLVAAMDGNPNVLLRLREPVLARGPLGITRRPTAIALGLDDPAGFLRALTVPNPTTPG